MCSIFSPQTVGETTLKFLFLKSQHILSKSRDKIVDTSTIFIVNSHINEHRLWGDDGGAGGGHLYQFNVLSVTSNLYLWGNVNDGARIILLSREQDKGDCVPIAELYIEFS